MGSPRVMSRQLSFLVSALGEKCLPWPGELDRDGYGRTTWRGKLIGAHCLAYELFVDSIPVGCEIHHTCGNRGCVHPAHLVAIGHNDHMRCHRLQYGDRCKWGHALTPENTRRKPNGTLVCKPCQARRSREFKAKRRVKAEMA